MNRTYEGMFLLDNDAVRAGWREAKAVITGLVEKNGGEVLAARRWDERRLAYPVRNRRRATYMLAFYSIDPTNVDRFVRDLDINEVVLRYLMTRVETVPAGEIELSQAEEAADFTVPEPPADDVVEVPETAAEGESDGGRDSGGDGETSSKGDEGRESKREERTASARSSKGEGDALVGATRDTEEGKKE